MSVESNESSETKAVLHGVSLMEDGSIELAYMRMPVDLRVNRLMWQHSVIVPAGSDYDEEIDAVYEALTALLDDVLDDEDRVEPMPLGQEDEDDEEEDQ